jgi:hypothetical protein
VPTWSFADLSGRFTGRRFTGQEERLAANTPTGEIPVLGEHDPIGARYEVSSGRVVVYADPRARQLTEESMRASAAAALEVLDGRAQRALREIAINPNDEAARQRLLHIEEQAAPLRERIRRPNGAG